MDNLIPRTPVVHDTSCRHNNKDKKRRCLFCGCHYKADPRLGRRQKSCPRSACRKRRKSQSQQVWLKQNPGYFANRYENVIKPWRNTHSAYQRQRRARLKREIQDTIARQKANGRGFVVYGRLPRRDTRHDSHTTSDEALHSS